MKGQDLIKYAAMAVAAYVLYQWLKNNGYLGPATQQALPPAQGGGVPATYPHQPVGAQYPTGGGTPPAQQQPPTQQEGPTGGNTPPPPANGGDIKSQTAAAAQQKGAPSKMNFWDWNFYLPQGVTRPDPFATNPDLWEGGVPVDVPDVQSRLLTVDQWWVIAQSGMSGVPQAGMGKVNHWGQAASQGYPNRESGSNPLGRAF